MLIFKEREHEYADSQEDFLARLVGAKNWILQREDKIRKRNSRFRRDMKFLKRNQKKLKIFFKKNHKSQKHLSDILQNDPSLLYHLSNIALENSYSSMFHHPT